MPALNRRRFLQMASAAGLAPALPAFSARAATASAMTSAQMLWASLHANGGSAPNVTGLARAMGISPKAAQGVYAKLIQNHALTAHAAARLSQMPRAVSVQTAAVAKTAPPRAIKVDIQDLLGDDMEDDDIEIVDDISKDALE